MTDLPTGTVTFLFTDIEGSTRLVQRLGSGYRAVLEDHNQLLRDRIRWAGGVDLRTEGDAVFAVFQSAEGAVAAATAAQTALFEHTWPEGVAVRVRMGLHTGEGALGGDDYVGIDVHRAARVASAAHGGQIVISSVTGGVVARSLPPGSSLRELGEHRLKDFDDTERLLQVVVPGLPEEFPPLRTLDAPSKLPRFATSFVPRAEVAALRERIGSARLVTLTGPGGTGKTRLAVEAASGLASDFPDGVTFADLGLVSDPRLMLSTIAETIGLQVQGDRSVEEALVDHLRDRRALLILDNLEQILPAAEDVARLLEAAPRISILATSRGPLSLRGEQEFPVPPLGLPNHGGTDPASIVESEAVMLFVERARAVDPGFSVDDETARAVAEICARLDGLPLAIELAASRIRLLPPGELLARLDRRLSILTGGPRDAPERQQTLREAIGWSHDLLDDAAATLFRRLSVFSGGWTLDAAEAVANPGGELGDTLEGLGALVQAALVRREPGQGPARFGLLETIREFGLEKLEASGEAQGIRRRHAERMRALAREAEPELIGRDHVRWLELLTREHDNVRAALAWAVEADDAGIGLEIGAGVWRFWQFRNHLTEGGRWLADLLALPSGRDEDLAGARGRALIAAAGLAYWRGDIPSMRRDCEEALSIARASGDRPLEAEALYNLAFVIQAEGDRDGHGDLLEEARVVFEEVGDDAGLGRVALARSFWKTREGDLEAILHQAQVAAELLDRSNDYIGYTDALGQLGQAALIAGDLDEGLRYAQIMVRAFAESENASRVVTGLRVLSAVAVLMGDEERAVRLLGTVEALYDRYQVRPPVGMVRQMVAFQGGELSLDSSERRAVFEEGRAMTMGEAVAYALGEG